MRWKTVERGPTTEVWIESTKPNATFLYRVIRSPHEAGAENEQGMEVFGMDRDLCARYMAAVIAPCAEGKPCDVGSILEVLSCYLERPEKYDGLLALMTGRIHLVDYDIDIDPLLSKLVIEYAKEMNTNVSNMNQMLVSSWCYELMNTLFVVAGTREEIEGWVQEYRNSCDRAFVEGLKKLSGFQPRIADYCALLTHIVGMENKRA